MFQFDLGLDTIKLGRRIKNVLVHNTGQGANRYLLLNTVLNAIRSATVLLSQEQKLLLSFRSCK